jgi:putative PIN family toxin of toxin-antitoxin system
MKQSRPDVVFDCNVFLQAISRVNGPAAHALRLVEENAVTLHLSRAILRELRRTLAYPEIRQRNPHVTDEVIDSFITRLLFRGVLLRNVPHVVEHPRDPKDEPYLDLAAAVNADFLVTRDNDLLYLTTDHSIEAKQFRQRFPAIKILTPVDFTIAISHARTGPPPDGETA